MEFSAQRTRSLIPGLVDDVVHEMFLHFVAIDWNGPFTLILVSTAWRNVVISKPRFWTWIMVDDTDADWKMRADVGAHLSRNLPLQIVLKMPFTSDVSVVDLSSRCTTLIYEIGYITRWSDVKRHKHINDYILLFLKHASKDRIRVLYGSRDFYPLRYLNDTAYNEIKGGNQLSSVLSGDPSTLIMRLELHYDPGDKGESAVRVQLTELWNILPSLIHLNHLKLNDNMVIWKKDTVLLPVLLPSLQTLDIISPMSHWIFFSFEEDTWLGLFSILDYLSAPHIKELTLRGSLQRTLAVVAKGNTNVCPSNLSLYILSLDQAIDGPVMGINPAWHRLNRVRLDVPFHDETMFSRQSFSEASLTFDTILLFLPKTCLVCVETQSVVPFPLGLAETVNIEYDHYFRPGDGWSKDNIAKMHTLRLFVADIALSRGNVRWSPSDFIEHVTAVDQCLKTTRYSLFLPNVPDNFKYTRIFAELEYLRCFPDELVPAVSVFQMRNLRLLYIELDDWSYDTMETTYQCMMEHAEHLPRLMTLHFESSPIYWKLLIDFVGTFNKSGGRGGITTLKLPTPPHPDIVREIKAALNSGPEGYVTGYLGRGQSEYEELEGCWACFENGWVCVGKEWCTRPFKGPWVTITKDTDWRGIDWYAHALSEPTLDF